MTAGFRFQSGAASYTWRFPGLCKIFLLFILLTANSLLQAQNLNYYYGNIHAHTSYSDGNKDSASSGMTTPLQAFNYAKQSSHIDFYGISEHNHYAAGMRSPLFYRRGLNDADAATVDGDFVAMYGMEWGVISSGGHLLVYGSDSLCGWDFGQQEIAVAEADYARLYRVINRKPGSFAYLAHPQSGDYTNLFTQAYNAAADEAIVGLAMRSGPAFSTNSSYSNPSTSNYQSRYNDALKRGYHLGPGIDHDTHNSVFGRQSSGRLVVLAPLLNRAEIYNAFRQNRFYASDDWNVKVNFRIQNRPMGSRITQAGNPTLSVQVDDPDGENVSSIVVYGGVAGSGSNPTQITSVSNSNTLSYTHNVSPNQEYYYYLYIVQTNGDKIWTAPIWYTRNDNILVQAPQADFDSAMVVCSNNPRVFEDHSLNAPDTWWWSAPEAYPANSSLQHPTFVFSSPGTYQVSLVVSNAAGSDTLIRSITVGSPPVVSVSGTDSICKGRSVVLSASGADTYVWSNGAQTQSITVSPQTNTQYRVSGYINGCFDTAQKTIRVYQALPTPVITKLNDTLFSSASSGNQWYYYNSQIEGANDSFYVPTLTGYYQVQVSDSLGCRSELSLPLALTVGLMQKNVDAKGTYLVYPNPTQGSLWIVSSELRTQLMLEVFTSTGYPVHKQTLGECSPLKPAFADLTHLSRGVYVLRIGSGKEVFETKVKLE